MSCRGMTRYDRRGRLIMGLDSILAIGTGLLVVATVIGDIYTRRRRRRRLEFYTRMSRGKIPESLYKAMMKQLEEM